MFCAIKEEARTQRRTGGRQMGKDQRWLQRAEEAGGTGRKRRLTVSRGETRGHTRRPVKEAVDEKPLEMKRRAKNRSSSFQDPGQNAEQLQGGVPLFG